MVTCFAGAGDWVSKFGSVSLESRSASQQASHINCLLLLFIFVAPVDKGKDPLLKMIIHLRTKRSRPRIISALHQRFLRRGWAPGWGLRLYTCHSAEVLPMLVDDATSLPFGQLLIASSLHCAQVVPLLHHDIYI